MKKIKFSLALIAVSLSALACVIPAAPTVLRAQVEGQNAVIEPTSTFTPAVPSVVIATKALWLRDARGVGLTVMPNGSLLDVIYCRTVRETKWAFGYFIDQHGKRWVGYAAARYLSGACK